VTGRKRVSCTIFREARPSSHWQPRPIPEPSESAFELAWPRSDQRNCQPLRLVLVRPAAKGATALRFVG